MILGHKRQLEYLNKVFARGRMSHAYLFYGPEHVGKYTVAKNLARALQCVNRSVDGNNSSFAERACGECSSCQALDQDSHPHIAILDLDHTLVSKKETRKDIPIEDIRELRRVFSLAPEGKRWRVAIINQAEKMNEEAANAFLKLLEEPGAETLFLLITSAKELLPQTIVSRTQPLRFSLISEKIIHDFLQEEIHDKEERQELIALSEGRPGILFTMLRDPSFLEAEKKFSRAFAALPANQLSDALRFSERAAGNLALREKTVFALFHELRSRLLKNPDDPTLVSAIKFADRAAVRMATTNVNPRLALDMMFLEIFGSKKSL